MSPPIRDGSGDSIGAIRLGDGSEISEVRTGAGDVVFSGTPGSVIDNFEPLSGDPSGPYESGDGIGDYYRGFTSGFNLNDTSPIDNTQSLETTAGNGFAIVSEPGDGLPRYHKDNEPISAYVRDESTIPGILFATTYDSSNDNLNGYSARLFAGSNKFELYRYDNSSTSDTNSNRTKMAGKNVPSVSKNTTFLVEITPPNSSGNMSATLSTVNGSLNKDSELATVTTTDATHYGNRGHGVLTSNTGTGVLADSIEVQ